MATGLLPRQVLLTLECAVLHKKCSCLASMLLLAFLLLMGSSYCWHSICSWNFNPSCCAHCVIVPALAGIPAVAGNSAVDGVLLMLTSLLYREFPPLSASLLLLASLMWRLSLLCSTHAVTGVFSLVGILLFLTSLCNKKKQRSVSYSISYFFA